MSILAIPIEIALIISDNLSPEDLFNWSLSCKQFGYLIQDNAVCRASLKACPFSREALGSLSSGSQSQALRTYVKRRAAVKNAHPFAVANVAVAESFIYSNGAIICTQSQSRLRILNLDTAQHGEKIFDVRQLLRDQTDIPQGPHRQRFRPLYYAANLASCLYSCKSQAQSLPCHWLMVINVVSGQVVTAYQLDRVEDIWVRNDGKWLYCGISSETDYEDVRSWLLFQYSLERNEWASNRIMLPNMPHGDMGIGNCFEVLDGYLYGASSRMPVDYENNKWNSYYYVFRFPLGQPSQAQVLDKRSSWRRNPADGNVDDRWVSLQLVKDENTGEIYLYESRREYLESRPQSQRNCYRKKLVFMDEPTGELYPGVGNEPEGWDSEIYQEEFGEEDIHHGDDWYSGTTYSVLQAPIRTYVPSCGTFLDVVSDSPVCAIERPSLRFRARPAADGRPNFIKRHDCPKAEVDAEVRTWPDASLTGPELTCWRRVMCPPAYMDRVTWYADERFIVYAVATGNKLSSQKHIVAISFDPTVRIAGLRGSGGRDVVGGLPQPETVPKREGWANDGSVSGLDLSHQSI